MTDLYAVLGVGRDAARSEIESKIKQQFRVWNKRVNSPDLNKRQEAEQRVSLLTQAREKLLDDAKRAEYDRKLAVQAQAAPVDNPQQTVDAIDWLQRAKEHLAVNDYNSAAYAAREARSTQGQSVEVWDVLSRANAGMGRLNDALYEAQQAAQLDASNPERYLDVAQIHERLENWDAALNVYQEVRSAPGLADAADLGIGTVLLNTDRYAEAAQVLQHLLGRVADPGLRRDVGDYLAIAQLSLAEEIPLTKVPEGFVITAASEIAQMRLLVGHAFAVASDEDLKLAASDLEAHLRECEAKKFWPAFPLRQIVTSILWCSAAAAVLMCLGTSWWPPFLIASVLMCGIGVLRIVWLVRTSHMEQWAINAAVQAMEDHEAASRQQMLNDPNYLYNRSLY